MWEWASFNTPAPHSPGCGKICFNFWNKLTINLIPKLIILQCGQPFNSSPRLGLVVMTVMVLMMISGKGSRRAISGRMTEARRTRMGLQLHSYCHHHHFIIIIILSSCCHHHHHHLMSYVMLESFFFLFWTRSENLLLLISLDAAVKPFIRMKIAILTKRNGDGGFYGDFRWTFVS